jgi:plastocyanin
VTIAIVGMSGANSYSVSPVPIKAGQKVAWKNADGMAHTRTG